MTFKIQAAAVRNSFYLHCPQLVICSLMFPVGTDNSIENVLKKRYDKNIFISKLK